MAKIKSFKDGVDKVKNHAFEINEFTVQTADEVVEVAIENTLRWQKLFGKALKGGSKLFWKQQDLALSALENVSDQVVDNSQKLADFLEVDNVLAFFQPVSKVKKAATEAKAKKDAIIKKAYPVTSKVIRTVKAGQTVATTESKKAEKLAKKAVKKASKKAKKVSKKVAITPTKAVNKVVVAPSKATKKATKKTAKKATATKKTIVKKSAAKKVTSKTATPKAKVERKVVRTIRKDDLQAIKGIGAKTEILLNEAGIYSFKDLAKASNKKIQGVLETAGPRFAKFDASIWTKQATLAIEGKLTK